MTESSFGPNAHAVLDFLKEQNGSMTGKATEVFDRIIAGVKEKELLGVDVNIHTIISILPELEHYGKITVVNSSDGMTLTVL